MKKRILIALGLAVFFILSSGLQNYADKPIKYNWKYVQNGSSLYVQWVDGVIRCYVTVYRRTDQAPNQTYLYYSIYDLSWNEIERGYGYIPNGDFRGSPNNKMFLDTDTSNIPGFFNSGIGGLISIKAEADFNSKTRIDGASVYHLTIPGIRISHSIYNYGSIQNSSATLEGNVLGYEIGDTQWGSLFKYHDVMIQFSIYFP